MLADSHRIKALLLDEVQLGAHVEATDMSPQCLMAMCTAESSGVEASWLTGVEWVTWATTFSII